MKLTKGLQLALAIQVPVLCYALSQLHVSSRYYIVIDHAAIEDRPDSEHELATELKAYGLPFKERFTYIELLRTKWVKVLKDEILLVPTYNEIFPLKANEKGKLQTMEEIEGHKAIECSFSTLPIKDALYCFDGKQCLRLGDNCFILPNQSYF